MANKTNRRPILHKGELYSSSIVKRGGPPPKPNKTYEEARQKIIADINHTEIILKQLTPTLKLPNESVVCFKLQSEYSAKSYYPDSLFNASGKLELKEIGSRIWREKETSINDEIIGVQGKLLFVRVKETSLANLKSMLNKSVNTLTTSFIDDVRRLSSIGILSADEKILGFKDNWEKGMLEIILHPLGVDKGIVQAHFYELLEETGINLDLVKFRPYEEGITFVSLPGNKELIKTIANYNPLRTLHPLSIRELSSVFKSSSSVIGAPTPTTFTNKSNIWVGVFDGGMKQGNKYLDNYTEVVDSVNGTPTLTGEEHGANVTSAILYGAINEYKNQDILPEPSVCVKNFRVLSQDNIKHDDLYEVIDAIELEVENNKNIKVFNLSIGPNTPILDDNISRFTTVCDKLSYKNNILFCSAVGNDGNETGYDRIQSPSDMVNGLAIGSYTKIDGVKVRADYSCVGPGREGNKLKPDFLAFGGCKQYPINLLSYEFKSRVSTLGTSFATPLVSKMAALLIGSSKNVINPLIARALLIHATVEGGKKVHSNEIGFGILPEHIDEIISCSEKSYTLIYNGEIEADKYIKFEIPWVDGIQGKVYFRWTSVILTDVDVSSPDDYTSSSIITSFYPNEDIFLFTKKLPNKKTVSEKVNVFTMQEKVVQLKTDGYKQGSFPVSDSKASSFKPELSLKKDLKWDSVESRDNSKNASNIKKPVFHVHAVRRGKRTTTKKVKYAFILTVEAPNSTIDLYTKIVNNYRALTPIKIEIKNIIQANQTNV